MSGSHFMEQASILFTKATTIRDGIKVALQAGFRRIEVEGDNQIVLKAMKTQINTPWQVAPVLQDIRNTILSCESLIYIYLSWG